MTKHRSMRRDDWQMITKKSYLLQDFEYDGFRGKISLLRMDEVSESFSVPEEDHSVKIVEKDYCWLQVAPAGEFVWFTAMFDEQGNFIECYVDMTDGNVTEAEDPNFDDMYLDFVILKDKILELDRDELKEAYDNKIISEEQYEKTLLEGKRVKEYISEKRENIINALRAAYGRMVEKMQITA